ncbi:MAG: CRISPR-associated endonuclease Cas2 [Thermosphaera sp.]
MSTTGDGMIVLIVYDISDNNVRLKLSNYLLDRGLSRVQKSVFIGRLLPTAVKDVERILPKYVACDSDVIHLIPLLEYSVKYMKHWGKPLSDITSSTKTYTVI